MNYQTANAFRTALEVRLNRAAERQGNSGLPRVRKAIVFDRLLARLMVVAPDRWIIKGGFALDLRLGERARVTKDLDLARQDNDETAFNDLLEATGLNLNDFFTFTIQGRSSPDQNQEEVATRYLIEAQLAGRRFERVTVDIGFGAALIRTPDQLTTSPLLDFADIAPVTVPALPLEQHLAEKIHAYTRSYGVSRTNTRAKDLIDILLIRSVATFIASDLRRALRETFNARATHPMPSSLPRPPQDWLNPYHVMATDIELDPNLMTGFEEAASFVDPILSGSASDSTAWNPVHAEWSERISARQETAVTAQAAQAEAVDHL